MRWVVDVLHSWALGPLAYVIAFVIRFCLRTKVWHPAVIGISTEDTDRLAMMQIRSLLLVYYNDNDVSSKAVPKR